MPFKLDSESRQRLNKSDFLLTQTPSGVPRNTYWTPDGTQVFAIPMMREYVKKDATGKIIEQGVRDANTDQGLLLYPPTPAEVQLHCAGCNRWHKTKAEILKCVRDKHTREKEWELKAQAMHKKENGSNNGEVESLKKELAELKQMIKELKHG